MFDIFKIFKEEEKKDEKVIPEIVWTSCNCKRCGKEYKYSEKHTSDHYQKEGYCSDDCGSKNNFGCECVYSDEPEIVNSKDVSVVTALENHINEVYTNDYHVHRDNSDIIIRVNIDDTIYNLKLYAPLQGSLAYDKIHKQACLTCDTCVGWNSNHEYLFKHELDKAKLAEQKFQMAMKICGDN